MMDTWLNGPKKTAPRVLCNAMGRLLTAALLTALTGCAAVDLANPWDRYYDRRCGVGTEDIREHFNLHRGQWWNYYARGSLYLAYEHYPEAQADFATATAKRSRDTRDARTYGMHFVDYFPHRECGVAYYLQGEGQADVARKETSFREAIAQLETSLRQEESSRAKFYLNQARAALWKTTGQDTTAPTVHVKKPVYTKQRTVRLAVTATDSESYVGEIRIGTSVGDIRIQRPILVSELAGAEVKETVELTLGPREKMAVVAITAFDLAGNESEPDNTLIILDTQVPVVTVAVVGDETRPDGSVEVAVRARDDFGLKQIKVGESPNDTTDCDGALKYSGLVRGTPSEGELAITVVDSAGNAIVAGLPIPEVTGLSRPAPVAGPPTAWRFPRVQGVDVDSASRPPSPVRLSQPGVCLPHSPTSLCPEAYARVASLSVFPERTGDRQGSKGPVFHFPPHVRPDGDKAKETSESPFIVEGTLGDPWDITRITINGKEATWDPPILSKTQWNGLRVAQEWALFQGNVDLAGTPVDGRMEIEVKAYRQGDLEKPFIGTTLQVIRREDGRRGSDSVYGMLLLPLRVRRQFAPSSWLESDRSRLDFVYRTLLNELRALRLPGTDGQEPLGRFRVYEVNDIFAIPMTDAEHGRKTIKEGIVSQLSRWRNRRRQDGPGFPRRTNGVDPNLADLVIQGDLIPHDPNDGFSIELRATDVSSKRDLWFPEDIDTDRHPYILADVFIPAESLETSGGTQWIGKLAFDVGERLPRLQAEIKTDTVSIRTWRKRGLLEWLRTRFRGRVNPTEAILTIDCGTKHRVFDGMRLWLYGKDTLRNPKLTKLGGANIISPDRFSSLLEPEDETILSRVVYGDIGVTK